MTRPIRTISIIVLLLLAAGAWFLFKPANEAAGPGPKGHNPNTNTVTITAARVTSERFSEALMLNGEVIPAEHVDVFPEITGRVVAIEFKEGARVTAGQTLVKLYDADIRAQLKKLRAQLELDSLQLTRYESMRKLDGVSMQDVDAARAQVHIRRADIEQTQAMLDKTLIKAPFTGTVGLRLISVGAVVTPQSKITSLADVSSKKIDVAVPDRYAYAVHVGNTIRCVMHTNRGSDTVHATVFAEDPVVMQNTRSLKVRALIQGANDAVPGTVVDVLLNTAAIDAAIMVPSQSIQPGMNGATVFVIKDGVVQETPVVLGGRTADRVHVISGLMPGDVVATNGLLVLKQGMTVKADIK